MNKPVPHTTGYILAGGKSSRMGEDKGLKLFNGKALVQTVIDQMKLAVEKVVIVSNNSDYKQFGLKVIEDVVKNIGPAGGIYTALKHSNTDKNFIVSCDMPFITAESIAFMIENIDDSEITMPEMNGKLEPLFGVYSKICLPGWKILIDDDCIKLQEMVQHYNLKTIDVAKNPFFSEKLFRNINTRTDFINALKTL